MATPKFFITHSWKDIEFARCLLKDLKAHGVDGWMDDSTVRGGQRLAEEINRGLEGCDVYLPIMSPAALESPWCWEEINAAVTLANRRGHDKQLRIISIIALQCELPALLSSRLYFDFIGRYDDALAELLSKGFGIAVQSLPSRSVHPAPIENTDASLGVDSNTNPPVPTVCISPEELDGIYWEAIEAFHLEKWRPAADVFRKIVSVQPDYEDAADKLAQAEHYLKESQLASLDTDAFKAINEERWGEASGKLELLLAIDADYKDARQKLILTQNNVKAGELYNRRYPK